MGWTVYRIVADKFDPQEKLKVKGTFGRLPTTG